MPGTPAVSLDEYEARAEGEIIEAMGATKAALDRARSMLARPQMPLTPLIAGYARDPEALRPVLRRLNEAPLPVPWVDSSGRLP